MPIVLGYCDSRVEEYGVAVWRWLLRTALERWPAADVRYRAYVGAHHRQWRVLLPTGQQFTLAMTDDALEALGPDAIGARLEAAGWPDRALELPSAGVLLDRDGTLVTWEPRAGAVSA